MCFRYISAYYQVMFNSVKQISLFQAFPGRNYFAFTALLIHIDLSHIWLISKIFITIQPIFSFQNILKTFYDDCRKSSEFLMISGSFKNIGRKFVRISYSSLQSLSQHVILRWILLDTIGLTNLFVPQQIVTSVSQTKFQTVSN